MKQGNDADHASMYGRGLKGALVLLMVLSLALQEYWKFRGLQAYEGTSIYDDRIRDMVIVGLEGILVVLLVLRSSVAAILIAVLAAGHAFWTLAPRMMGPAPGPVPRPIPMVVDVLLYAAIVALGLAWLFHLVKRHRMNLRFFIVRKESLPVMAVWIGFALTVFLTQRSYWHAGSYRSAAQGNILFGAVALISGLWLFYHYAWKSREQARYQLDAPWTVQVCAWMVLLVALSVPAKSLGYLLFISHPLAVSCACVLGVTVSVRALRTANRDVPLALAAGGGAFLMASIMVLFFVSVSG